VSRDQRYHSTFVYAVASTRIFCRPTCTSRKPDKSKIIFFADRNLAKSAGFRPCLRCKPENASYTPSHLPIIEKLCRYIDENYEEKITLKRLGELAAMSPFHLQRIFKGLVGVTPREYHESARLRRLKMSLRNGETITKSIYKAGYNSSSWLYSHQSPKLGMHPSIYKSGGEGLVIDYEISDCRLGKLLVAGTERGICAVSLGNSESKLLGLLRAEYPNAKLVHNCIANLSHWMSAILTYVDHSQDLEQSQLPIDIQVTAFQWKVLRELQRIPFGVVRSYSEIAKRVGCPDGSRAVANVCASNPVPLVIPCHRVIRKGGELGGYGFGIEIKKKLLEGEGLSFLTKSNGEQMKR
jgi:AraC family transcriptional regulator of adaptative response/methylated-DNA-[protein]-cysteine methyltransferase